MKWNVFVITYHLCAVVGRDDDDQAIFGPSRGSNTESVIAESQDAAVKGLIEHVTDFSDSVALIVEHIGNGPQNVLVVPPSGLPYEIPDPDLDPPAPPMPPVPPVPPAPPVDPPTPAPVPVDPPATGQVGEAGETQAPVPVTATESAAHKAMEELESLPPDTKPN
jgi:hypothetical protein